MRMLLTAEVSVCAHHDHRDRSLKKRIGASVRAEDEFPLLNFLKASSQLLFS